MIKLKLFEYNSFGELSHRVKCFILCVKKHWLSSFPVIGKSKFVFKNPQNISKSPHNESLHLLK